jgi:hypothetical protein
LINPHTWHRARARWALQAGETALHERDSRLSQLNFAYHWRD